MTALARKAVPRPDDETIQCELDVTLSISKKYGTNQPYKTFEDGIAAALLWILGKGEMPNGGAKGWNS